MKIVINGEEKNSLSEISITELLNQEHVKTPEMVSVQLNGIFIDRTDFDSIIIKENDSIDFLYFMGGGN